MEIDEPFDNRESKAGAIVLAPTSAADLERIADVREIFRRDTDAAIRHFKQDVPSVQARAYRHGPVTVAEFDRVGQQIDQYLHDRAPVRRDFGEAARHLDLELDPNLLGPQRQQFSAACDDGIKLNRLRGKSELAGLKPRHVEYFIGDGEQVMSRFVDDPRVFQPAGAFDGMR